MVLKKTIGKTTQKVFIGPEGLGWIHSPHSGHSGHGCGHGCGHGHAVGAYDMQLAPNGTSKALPGDSQCHQRARRGGQRTGQSLSE